MRPQKIRWEDNRFKGEDISKARLDHINASFTAWGDGRWEIHYYSVDSGFLFKKGRTTSLANAKMRVAKAYRNLLKVLPEPDDSLSGKRRRARRKQKQQIRFTDRATAIIIDQYSEISPYSKKLPSAAYIGLSNLANDLKEKKLTRTRRFLEQLIKDGMASKRRSPSWMRLQRLQRYGNARAFASRYTYDEYIYTIDLSKLRASLKANA